MIGKVALLIGEERIDAEFLPALFPEAAVVVFAYPGKSEPLLWNMKVRRGLSAPPDFILDPGKIRLFDPHFGGRWNAGSNNRAGGTSLEPAQYARNISQLL
jgi:hypothetical protein